MMNVADVIRAWDTEDDLSDEETNHGATCASEQQNTNSNSDSSPDESDSKNSSDEEETNGISFRPGLLAGSTTMGKNKTIWKRAPASVTGRTSACNVFTAVPGVARHIATPMMHGNNLFLKEFFA